MCYNILMDGIIMSTSNITNYKPKDFAELLGVSVKTLQRWDREGVSKLLKSFKTEINPTIEQKIKINKTIGTCRYVYNFYLSHNKALYDKGEKFIV